MEKTIEKHALLNASRHKGKANPKNVLGSVINELPDFKKDMKANSRKVQEVVARVNKLTPSQQQERLAQEYPELLEKKAPPERDLFAFLNIPQGMRIRTAFPPGPEKYPHIGHAKALIANHHLAKQYGGEFYLRFEDTNPQLVKKEYYDIMLQDFRWLGITWDKLDYASDHMKTFYKHAEELMEKGKAYLCTCDKQTIQHNRKKGTACKCRTQKESFKTLFTAPEGSWVVRLKIDMKHKNSTMRDPTIMRIIDEPHARTKKKYRVWPTYDFQNAIMDGIQKITHRLRSKEFELRNELQRYIQGLLGYQETRIYEFARFNLEGVESSGRVIREKIDNEELIGWDDPSLTTLAALRRRGFLPEAITSFVLSTGITKSESTLTWDDLIMHNKRLLDRETNRYFFIEDPVPVKINGTPEQKIFVKLHPDDPERGKRAFSINEHFLLAKKDLENIEDNELVRLIDCLNFIKQGDKFVFHSFGYEYYKGKGTKIIQWLNTQDNVQTHVLRPDHAVAMGVAEPSIRKLKEGDMVQFNRFGFCRLDQKKKERMNFWFTHS